jgi:hypothetical protein
MASLRILHDVSEMVGNVSGEHGYPSPEGHSNFDQIQCEAHRTGACAGPQILTWTDFPLVLGEKLGQMSTILRFRILRSRDLSPIFGSDLP